MLSMLSQLAITVAATPRLLLLRSIHPSSFRLTGGLRRITQPRLASRASARSSGGPGSEWGRSPEGHRLPLNQANHEILP